MIANATATGIGQFNAFAEQKTAKVQGYTLLEVVGSRYPINATLTEQQFDVLHSQLESCQSVPVTLEVWAKAYINSKGEHKASLNTKLLSIG